MSTTKTTGHAEILREHAAYMRGLGVNCPELHESYFQRSRELEAAATSHAALVAACQVVLELVPFCSSDRLGTALLVRSEQLKAALALAEGKP